MNSKIFQSAMLVVFIALCISGWQFYSFYNGQYAKNEREIKNLLVELEKVKEARRIWDEALKRGQGQANYNVRFNYLTEKGISGKEIGPTLLKKLNSWFQDHHLEFLKLQIHPAEKVHNMDKYAFTLDGHGKFKDIISSLRWIEEELRGVITKFELTSVPVQKLAFKKSINPRKLYFNVRWHWLEGAPKRLHSIVKIEGSVPEIRRNPFIPYRPAVKKVQKQAKPSGIVWRPAPASLKLQGILTVGSHYKAVINGEYLKEGQSVGGYRILSIQNDQVIVARGNVRCRLRLNLLK